MPNRIMSFDELINVDPSQYAAGNNLIFLGSLIDYFSDTRNDKALEKAFIISNQIKYEDLDNLQKIEYHYFLANGWSAKRSFNRFEKLESWDYDQEELTKELYHLRKCISIENFDDIAPERKCEIYTNLGNHFSHVGRFVEAQEWWHQALKVIPDFSMALGNIAQGLFSYAACLYEPSHRNIFAYHSHMILEHLLKSKKDIYPAARKAFNELLDHIKKLLPASYLNHKHSFDYDLGDNEKLRSYRRWCLDSTLYLNPLNDLAAYEVACHDILHLPGTTVPFNDTPKYYTLFNQIKQEYGTARFLFYKGTQLPAQSYSDEDIVLVDTLDYAEYSYNLEKVKIAYRLIYSLFDKIAYLLNHYLEVGIERHKIGFRELWHEKRKGDKPLQLRKEFSQNKNLALRGLYWLSKDFFNIDAAHTEVIEPEAKELALIRNHIEHKSFKVLNYGTWGTNEPDDFTFSIGREELERKTFKQMRLVRAAIIYTSLAIYYEEENKNLGPTLPITFPDMSFRDKF